MSHVTAARISVLVGQPFVFGGVCVSSTDVLALQMLKLAVDVVSFAHFAEKRVREVRN